MAATECYMTLVMSDSYLPGAMVLAHSLRDSGTEKHLVAMVTMETLSVDVINELKTMYELIPVPRIANPRPANLFLMSRADLLYAFTKIAVWRQTQFRRVLYLDADIVVLQNLDHLFDLDVEFAAAPDAGWPDAFNSGLMLIRPDMGEYHALYALAQSGDSFDGADQGLLNQYFEHRPWHRLSFLYNTTPNAEYQWEPAYRYHKSNIRAAHFIGKDKPWFVGRQVSSNGVYGELVGKWWSTYDKHYKQAPEYVPNKSYVRSTAVQERVFGESVRDMYYGVPENERLPPPAPTDVAPSIVVYEAPKHDEFLPLTGDDTQHEQFQKPVPEVTIQQPSSESRQDASEPPPEHHEHHGHQGHQGHHEHHGHQGHHEHHGHQGHHEHHEHHEQHGYHEHHEHHEHPSQHQHHEPTPVFQAPPMEWDATRSAPPEHSRPEAASFPTHHYTFEEEKRTFRPPPEYPRPPQDLWYNIPASQPHVEEPPKPIFPWEQRSSRSRATRVFAEDLPPTPELEKQSILSPPGPSWEESFGGMEQYLRKIIETQRVREQAHREGASVPPERRESLVITGFPSEENRPSLPVTPAPIMTSSFWGEAEAPEGQARGASPVSGLPANLRTDQVEWVCPRCGFSSKDPVAFVQVKVPSASSESVSASHQHEHILSSTSKDIAQATPTSKPTQPPSIKEITQSASPSTLPPPTPESGSKPQPAESSKPLPASFTKPLRPPAPKRESSSSASAISTSSTVVPGPASPVSKSEKTSSPKTQTGAKPKPQEKEKEKKKEPEKKVLLPPPAWLTARIVEDYEPHIPTLTASHPTEDASGEPVAT